MSDREALKRSIDDLSPMGVRFVARMFDSNSPCATSTPNGSYSPDGFCRLGRPRVMFRGLLWLGDGRELRDLAGAGWCYVCPDVCPAGM